MVKVSKGTQVARKEGVNSPFLALAPPRGYQVYGVCIRSEISLTVPAAVFESPDVELLVAHPSFLLEATGGIELKRAPSGWYQHGQLGDGSRYLRWDGLFEFLISADGRRIWCGWLGATSIEALQVYLLGHALSFALVHQGREPLHSTVVVIDGIGVAFLGRSGFGKSSLAASFVKAGYRILTDDLLLFSRRSDQFEAHPGPANQRKAQR